MMVVLTRLPPGSVVYVRALRQGYKDHIDGDRIEPGAFPGISESSTWARVELI